MELRIILNQEQPNTEQRKHLNLHIYIKCGKDKRQTPSEKTKRHIEEIQRRRRTGERERCTDGVRQKEKNGTNSNDIQEILIHRTL